MKEFILNGQKYLFEYNANEERKVKLFLKTQQGIQDLHGNQKRIIVEKLHEIMQENPHIAIDERKRQYIENYIQGIDTGDSETTNTLGKILNDCLEDELGGAREMLSREELTQKIKSLPTGTVIPKPESEKDFIIKGLGMRRGEEALIYRIPTENLEKYPRGHEKGVTFTEFYEAYTVLQKTSKLTREWFDENLPECAKEGGCNFTTIGGIFELLGIASYSGVATYKRL